MEIERRVVNNSVFLLGLDCLYRDRIKRHERDELLHCALQVTAALDVLPANDPVEGYYAEDAELTKYFLYIRALQQVAKSRTPEVAALPEFCRLMDVASSPIYGQSKQKGMLLPVGRDALSQALIQLQPEWNVSDLTTAACKFAQEMDDYSLVGLAARAKNPIVLTALRESVVLYAEQVCLIEEPSSIEYVWEVDDELSKQANRFIATFNALFNEELPAAESDQAERYWLANEDNDILGRCVRLGRDDTQDPPQYYHWALGLEGTEVKVQEFWDPEIWTTSRYRQTSSSGWRCPDL